MQPRNKSDSVTSELKDKALSFRERLMQKSEIAKDILQKPVEPEPTPVKSQSKPKAKPTQEDERKLFAKKLEMAISRKKKEVQVERKRLKQDRERKDIEDQIDRIAATKRLKEGDQALSVDVRADYIKGLTTMARISDRKKQFMNNVKNYIRRDSEDDDDERDLGGHTIQQVLV